MKSTDASAREVIALLTEKNITLATAESCTGGMIGATLTDVAGSSAVYLGGIISYANSVKESVLGVARDTLAAHGAVSLETAEAMARGARRLTGADIAVSVTGVAGPGGGSAEKPVGTVCFGIATSDGVRAERVQFPPTSSRAEIRCATVAHALALVLGCAREQG